MAERRKGAAAAGTEPPGRKSGAESVPEKSEGPPDPRAVPRTDSRPEEAAGESGRGIPQKKGGKL